MIFAIQIDGTPMGVWNLLELVLTIVFFLIGFYFIAIYFKARKNAIASVNQFNIGYAFFFWANALNQLIYIVDEIPGLVPQLDLFLSEGEVVLYLGTLLIFPLKTQIVMMLFLLFLSIVPLMRFIELYLKNNQKMPVFKLSVVGIILLAIIFVVFFMINRAIAPGGFTGPDVLYQGGTSSVPELILNFVLVVISLFIFVVTLLIVWNFFIFYLQFAFKTIGAMRAKSLMIFVGILLLYTGLGVGNLLKPDLTGWAILMGPIMFLMGMIVLIFGFNKKVL
jgi:hypothetical protein